MITDGRNQPRNVNACVKISIQESLDNNKHKRPSVHQPNLLFVVKIYACATSNGTRTRMHVV